MFFHMLWNISYISYEPYKVLAINGHTSLDIIDLSWNSDCIVRDNYGDIKTICHQQPFVCVLPHGLEYLPHFIWNFKSIKMMSSHNSKDIYDLLLSSSYIVRNNFDNINTICHWQPFVCVLPHVIEYLPHFIWNLKSNED